jgi:hypothetical protein
MGQCANRDHMLASVYKAWSMRRGTKVQFLNKRHGTTHAVIFIYVFIL